MAHPTTVKHRTDLFSSPSKATTLPTGFPGWRTSGPMVAPPKESFPWDSAPDIRAAWFASGSQSPDCCHSQGLSGWIKITWRRGRTIRGGSSRSWSGLRAESLLTQISHSWFCSEACLRPLASSGNKWPVEQQRMNQPLGLSCQRTKCGNIFVLFGEHLLPTIPPQDHPACPLEAPWLIPGKVKTVGN